MTRAQKSIIMIKLHIQLIIFLPLYVAIESMQLVFRKGCCTGAKGHRFFNSYFLHIEEDCVFYILHGSESGELSLYYYRHYVWNGDLLVMDLSWKQNQMLSSS